MLVNLPAKFQSVLKENGHEETVPGFVHHSASVSRSSSRAGVRRQTPVDGASDKFFQVEKSGEYSNDPDLPGSKRQRRERQTIPVESDAGGPQDQNGRQSRPTRQDLE